MNNNNFDNDGYKMMKQDHAPPAKGRRQRADLIGSRWITGEVVDAWYAKIRWSPPCGIMVDATNIKHDESSLSDETASASRRTIHAAAAGVDVVRGSANGVQR